jgi:hypothetical protein
MFQTTNQESMGVFILDDLLLFHYHRSSFVTLWQFNLAMEKPC